MGRALKAGVFVDGSFHPAGSEPPKAVAEQITNPKAWGKSVKDDPAPSTPAPAGDFPEGEPSEEWTGKQLDAYAASKSVDLGAAKNKADKVAAIKAAAQAQS